MKDTSTPNEVASDASSKLDSSLEKATPLRCFFAATLSGGIAFCSYLLFNSVVQTYATKTVTSTNPVVINLTAAVRTMVMGIVALGTGVFGVVAVGLFLLGIQLTVQSFKKA